MSPQKSDEDLALILSWVDVRVSDDEIAKQLNEIVTSDIDRMALSGWDFDQTSSVSLASGAAKEDGHWASVERRAVSPQGNEIRRDDLPHVVTVTVSTYPGSGMLSEQVIVSVWVFSDGHFEFHAPDIQELPECADELWNTVSEADRRSISVSHKLNQPRSAVNV